MNNKYDKEINAVSDEISQRGDLWELYYQRGYLYYLNDEDAYVKVEETWAETHEKEDRFAAYMLLAQNADVLQLKAQFLEKALDGVMEQKGSIYEKYQDTLNVCSQLAAIYELQGDKEKAFRIKKLRESTLNLLN